MNEHDAAEQRSDRPAFPRRRASIRRRARGATIGPARVRAYPRSGRKYSAARLLQEPTATREENDRSVSIPRLGPLFATGLRPTVDRTVGPHHLSHVRLLHTANHADGQAGLSA